ncbi:MAG TPA: SO_0444 family Cu/Zn efflux transporter [Sumerlaeia bacterium]|nr:SO_0444 family Cu/Zn efflux transporter [Sumerlaeia bacterium]
MAHLIGILRETRDLWLEMGIYLVFGFAVAGILSRLLKRETIARHLGGNSIGAVAKAALFGIPLPLCSCGVIPVGLSLHRRGASRGATTAFLISTPQTGVDSIAVTWAFLGPLFALARPVAALINGLLGGGIVTWLDRGQKGASAADAAGQTPGDSDCDACEEALRERGSVSFLHHAIHAFQYGFVDFPREIVNWLVVGILAAGVISYILPSEKEILREYLGSGVAPMVVMALFGIPLYICATASVPIVAVLVVKGGLSAGGALVFLMTGPATNIATLILIGRTLGRRTAAAYLGSILFTSFACGFALDAVYAASGSPLSVQAHHHGEHAMLPDWVRLAGGVGLALVVAGGLIQNYVRSRAARKEAAATALPAALASDGISSPAGAAPSLQLRVEGMTCSACVEHVRKAAQSVDGVEAAHVDLKSGIVRISGAAPSRDALVRAIEASGYKVAET